MTSSNSTSTSSVASSQQQKGGNNEQQQQAPQQFSVPTSGGMLPSGPLSQIGMAATSGHHMHDSRPPSVGANGPGGLPSNSTGPPSHSVFGPPLSSGMQNTSSDNKSALGPSHAGHASPAFSSSVNQQHLNDPRNALASPSPHSQHPHASSDSPFGPKHLSGSPSSTTGNLMSPAPPPPNASPLPGMHPKSATGLPPQAVTSNSPANMQMPSGAQIPPSATGSPLLGGVAGGFNSAGSISSRLGPPPPTHPFPPSSLHSNVNTPTTLGLKPSESAESRDKVSHGGISGPVPPPMINGYLSPFVTSGGGQNPQTSGVSRISPHPNAIPANATPPTTGLTPSSMSATSGTANKVSIAITSSSPHSSSASSTTTSTATQQQPSSSSGSTLPPSSIATSTLSKFPPHSSSGLPPIQSTAGIFGPGGLPHGLPPGVGHPGMLPGGIPPNGISPMLLHASPYRPPYPNYAALYAPYSGLPHSHYLPPAVPSPSASSPRTSRESPMMSQMAKPPSLRPPTPVSQSSSSTPVQTSSAQPSSISGSSTPTTTSTTPTTVSTPTPTSMPPTSVSLSHGVPPSGLPTSSMASHLLHHPHLPYPASLPIPQQILGGPPFSHPQSAMAHHHLSVSHPPAHSIASVTTTASTTTPLSATLSGTMNSGLNPPTMSREGAQILHPPPPHLLTHPHLGPPSHMPPLPPHMLPPHSALLRGASPTTTQSSSQPSQPPSATSTATSSSSVIHKGISPQQSESPSKERSDNNSAYLPRSSIANTHLSGGSFPPTSTTYLTAAMAPSSSSTTTSSSMSSIPHSAASLAISNASYSSTISLPTTTYASAGGMPMMMTTQQLPQPPPGSMAYHGGAPKHSMWPPR